MTAEEAKQKLMQALKVQEEQKKIGSAEAKLQVLLEKQSRLRKPPGFPPSVILCSQCDSDAAAFSWRQNTMTEWQQMCKTCYFSTRNPANPEEQVWHCVMFLTTPFASISSSVLLN